MLARTCKRQGVAAVPALVALLFAVFAAGCASVRPCGEVDVGLVASRDTRPGGAVRSALADRPRKSISRDTRPGGAVRRRAAGPFWEHRDAGRGRTFTAMRPFYAATTDTVRDRCLREVLWPVGMFKDLEEERVWRFLLGYGHDFDNRTDGSRYRGMVFPFVFWGRDKHDQEYFSIFPLGGTLHEFLGCDRILYVLFPLYAQSVTDNLYSKHFLWPIVTYARSEDIYRFRVFPFYGVSSDKGAYTKRFVLWPLWTHAQYHEEGCRGSSYILFPLFGRTRTEDQTGWMVLPPLFRWAKSDDLMEVYAPWPFFQYAQGANNKLYFWPIWGTREQDGSRFSFFLWPLGRKAHIERRDEAFDRFVLLPFVYHERVTQDCADDATRTEPAVVSRYFKLWPLFSYQRESDVSRVRLLELWPLKHTGPIERNMAPLWTLFTRTRHADRIDYELLWGLYRYRRDGAAAQHISLFPFFSRSRCDAAGTKGQWSLLLGLLGREYDADQSCWRLLWFLRFGDGD